MSKRNKGKKGKDFDSDLDEDVKSIESKGKAGKSKNDQEEKVKKKKGGKKAAVAR